MSGSVENATVKVPRARVKYHFEEFKPVDGKIEDQKGVRRNDLPSGAIDDGTNQKFRGPYAPKVSGNIVCLMITDSGGHIANRICGSKNVTQEVRVCNYSDTPAPEPDDTDENPTIDSPGTWPWWYWVILVLVFLTIVGLSISLYRCRNSNG